MSEHEGARLRPVGAAIGLHRCLAAVVLLCPLSLALRQHPADRGGRETPLRREINLEREFRL